MKHQKILLCRNLFACILMLHTTAFSFGDTSSLPSVSIHYYGDLHDFPKLDVKAKEEFLKNCKTKVLDNDSDFLLYVQGTILSESEQSFMSYTLLQRLNKSYVFSRLTRDTKKHTNRIIEKSFVYIGSFHSIVNTSEVTGISKQICKDYSQYVESSILGQEAE